ncbi:MAG: DUF1822 family protein [Cyanobacteria bacterium P01_A01_bin.83]
MVSFEEQETDLRLLLPEVIWLESEHFQQATEISNQATLEGQQWQTYLNILALSSFETWLRARIMDKAVKRSPNLLESVCRLTVGEFKLSLIAVEQVLDEVVSIPQDAIAMPELATHFYVVLEVNEEEEEVIIRGFLRYDELIAYQTRVNLSPQNGFYNLPLSLFDSELNHLLFYSRYLTPAAIPLPVVVPESLTAAFAQTINSTRTKLSQWLEGVLAEGWSSVENLITPEANLAWSTRNSPLGAGAKKGKLINLGINLKAETVALFITVTPEADQKLGILVQLYPTGEARYLPCNLQLTLISKAGKTLQLTQSREQDNYIQLKSFKGKLGTRFSIEVSMGDVSVREDFEL